jgi:cellulose synthase/poly-beta-1,6-N-acetylglucosamine synthase-like glycosyltransferase
VADQEGSDSRSPGGGLSVGLDVLWIVSLFILAFMILYAVTTFILIGLSLYEAVEQKIERGATFEPPRRPLRPGISLIAPAYKMDQVIVPSVISLLASDYDPLEVVIVDDGSTDGTLERMIVAFDLVDLPVGDRFQLETEQVERLYISRADPRLYVACKRKAPARTRSMRGSISRGKTGCDHRCGLDPGPRCALEYRRSVHRRP